MIWRIARREFVDVVRDGRFKAAAAIIGCLVVAALVTGWRHTTEVRAQHAQAAEATRAQWLGQPQKNPHSAAHYGVYAFKPRSALASIDTGVEAYVGVAAWLEAHKQNEFRYLPAADRVASARSGDLTAAMVLQVLMPLVIVLLAFGAIAVEREQGTLRLLLSQGVAAGELMRGKAMGTGAALAVLVVPAVLLGSMAVLMASGDGERVPDLLRLGVLSAVYLAWFVLWVSLTLAVSTLVQSSRTALMALLGVWMFNAVLAPRAAADLAAYVHPTPSAIDFQRALDRDLSDTKAMQAELEARKRALMAEHGVTRDADLPINFSGISLQAGEEHGNEVFDKHFGALYAQFARQGTVHTLAGIFAPLVPVRALSMGLAGTDLDQHRDFVNAAEAYRRGIQKVMNGDIARHQKPGQTYLAGPDLWQKVPPFEYRARSVGTVLAGQGWNLALLAVWCALSIVAASRCAGRVRAV